MRPYLAVIKDSFREAMASRVLWLLLVMTTLLLLVLAPLSYRLELTRSFGSGDIPDPPVVARILATAADQAEPSPAKAIWETFDEKTRGDIGRIVKKPDARLDGGEFFVVSLALQAMLNETIEKESLYDEKTWKDVRLDKEGEELVSKGAENLSRDERQRLNLLLVQAALPGQFRVGPAKSVMVTYLGLSFAGPWAAPETSMETFIEENILTVILSWLVGIAAIYVAIVVTSPIIPSMFEPGSLHLLLSKPINRSLLFLAKFFGGCAFILLNVGYLLGGFWLILGSRFGIWNRGLLVCIPLFMMLFALYYSVSALASVVWRSPVVSVMITMLFWLACFVVGILKVNLAEYTILNLQRITQIVPAGDELLTVNESGVVQRWNDDEQKWQQTFLPQDPSPFVGGPLIYDERKDRLVGVHAMPIGVTGMPFTSSFGVRTMPTNLCTGTRDNGWRRTIRQGVPVQVEEFFLDQEATVEGDRDDRLIAVSPRGIFRYAHSSGTTVIGLKLPFGGGDDFVVATEDPALTFASPVSAAANSDGHIAVYSQGSVKLFNRNKDGKYVLKKEETLREDDASTPAGLGFGLTILVAHEDGKLQLLDSKMLTVEHELRPVRSAQPRFIQTSPDGRRFAIVYHDGQLWIVDAASGKANRANVSGQGDISAAAFRDSQTLLVADRTTRVSEYSLNDMHCERRYSPRWNFWNYAYQYGAVPVYAVFPKPGELDNTVQFLLTEKKTSNQGLGQGLKARHSQLRPWAPVWSGLTFMVVMLGIACVYIERQEF